MRYYAEKIDRQTDRQTNRQTDRCRDRQTLPNPSTTAGVSKYV